MAMFHRTGLAMVVSLLLLILATMRTSSAEDAGLRIYRGQFLDLSEKTASHLERINSAAGSRMTPTDKQRLREENFALTKLIHRLGEEAGRTNLDGLQAGRSSNKDYLLIMQGCEGLSFVLMALDNLLDTDDRAFLLLAKQGHTLVGTIQKLLL